MENAQNKPVRKQYHTRQVGTDRHLWDVHRLMRASRAFEVDMIAVETIGEVDENWWYDDADTLPTPRSIAAHIALMNEVDVECPVILCAEGRLMDGMHRVVKALAEGRSHIPAVRFDTTPAPDFINVALDALPYPDETV